MQLSINEFIALGAKRELARRYLIDFTLYTNPVYEVNWHHEIYAQKLDQFARGIIKNLMVFMPPQHGKSELCSRRLPAQMLGTNPNLRIAVAAYNHTFASKFNRDIQRILDTQEYYDLFPQTNLNASNVRTIAGNYLRNSDEFEIVGYRGGLVSVGIGGGLTGRAVDIGIIDDPYKDAQDAWSATVRENVLDWYNTVFKTRLHNDSQQLITLTRWHPDDLAGTILKQARENWEIVVFPAIKENDLNPDDPRNIGEALWESKHSLERLLEIKNQNPHIFGSLYQQNPKPSEGLLFNIEELNKFEMEYIKNRKPDGIIAVGDVADTGADSFCMPVGYLYGKDCYIVDVLFTKAPVEITENLVLSMLERYKVDKAVFESNNGGRIFAVNIKSKNKTRCIVKWQATTQNKETRMLLKSGQVKQYFYFRSDYVPGSDYDKFMTELTGYLVEGKNRHDDAPDGVTILAEYLSRNRGLNINEKILRRP